MLCNTLRLNFRYLKIIHILHLSCHPKIIGHILKNKQKNKCACIHEIRRLNQHYATFEAQLMRRSTNTEAELKKALRIKKRVH